MKQYPSLEFNDVQLVKEIAAPYETQNLAAP
jgi:hypothetical protein